MTGLPSFQILMIDAIFTRLKPLIKWPGHEELQKTLPLDFRAHFNKCVVIIACFVKDPSL